LKIKSAALKKRLPARLRKRLKDSAQRKWLKPMKSPKRKRRLLLRVFPYGAQSPYGVRGRMCGSCVLSPTNAALLPARVRAVRALQQKTAPAMEAAVPRAKG
jgi:hypothetical protein